MRPLPTFLPFCSSQAGVRLPQHRRQETCRTRIASRNDVSVVSTGRAAPIGLAQQCSA